MNKQENENKEGKEEKNQTVSFAVTGKTKQMFDLLLLITGDEPDDVFRRMVGKYALKAVRKCIDKDDRGCGCSKRRYGHEHGHGYGHGFGMGMKKENQIGRGRGCGYGKAFGRIPLWSRRPGQFSHRIIKSFFRTEKDGVAMRDDMYAFFARRNPEVTRSQFDGNLNNMGTEGGNSHGHVFDFSNGEVRLAEQIAERVKLYREKFIVDQADE